MSGNVWAVEMPTFVTRNSPLPRLRDGLGSHLCQTCSAWERHEWSPQHHRACSAACLARQNPSPTIIQAVRERHHIELKVQPHARP